MSLRILEWRLGNSTSKVLVCKLCIYLTGDIHIIKQVYYCLDVYEVIQSDKATPHIKADNIVVCIFPLFGTFFGLSSYQLNSSEGKGCYYFSFFLMRMRDLGFFHLNFSITSDKYYNVGTSVRLSLSINFWIHFSFYEHTFFFYL